MPAVVSPNSSNRDSNVAGLVTAPKERSFSASTGNAKSSKETVLRCSMR